MESSSKVPKCLATRVGLTNKWSYSCSSCGESNEIIIRGMIIGHADTQCDVCGTKLRVTTHPSYSSLLRDGF